jgi:MinD-like ATPase involved in chromosome partitioning or flagellar assembly
LSYVVIGVTTKGGSGLSTYLAALAWDVAGRAKTLLVDGDPMGGDHETRFGLKLGPAADQLGLRRVVASGGSVDAIEAAAVQVKGRENLWILPGFRGESGLGAEELLARFGGRAAGYGADAFRKPVLTLSQTSFEVVILDLGQPFCYPGLLDPAKVGSVLARSSDRLVIVIKDDPTHADHHVEVLRKAALPRAELVVAHRPGASDIKQIFRQSLEENSINVQVADVDWVWRDAVALKAQSESRPMPAEGLAKSLGILGAAAAVRATVNPDSVAR